MKRLISVVLALCILLSCTMPVFATVPASPYTTTLPTIFLRGQGTALATMDANSQKHRCYPFTLSDAFVNKHIKGNIGVFLKAFFTQNWDEFCVRFTEAMADLFSEIRLDNQGHDMHGVFSEWPNQTKNVTVNGKYRIDQYQFEYDWRLDPLVIADELHQYIEAVMQSTGAEKVNIVSRCLGVSVTAAYMYKYKGEHIATYIQYNSAMNGVTYCSQSFAGDIWVDGDGLSRVVYDENLFYDEALNELMQSIVTILGKGHGLKLLAWAVNNVYKDIYTQIIPPVLTQSFATFPSYWSMVNDRDYEKAKALVFAGQEKEWADFIQIIDNFHYNIQMNMPKIFEEIENNGVKVFNINKYGFQTMPVSREDKILSDGVCLVSDSSWGATTSTLFGTLDEEYLKKADPKYISPDKQIDASTCLKPDTTWFIKDLSHKLFPVCVEELMATIFENPDMTVFSDSRFPQYLLFDRESETICPLTTENCNTYGRYNVTLWAAIKQFHKSLFTIVRNNIKGTKK